MANIRIYLLCHQTHAVKHGSFKTAHTVCCAALLCETILLVRVTK